MNDFDDVSDEERRLAAELAAHLEENGALRDLPEDLTAPLSLLDNIDHFELDPSARSRGRAEIERRVETHAKGGDLPKAATSLPKWRFLYWLPLPTAAALVLVFSTFGPPQERGGTANTSSTADTYEREDAENRASSESNLNEPGFSPLPPRYHVGETPRALLSAQAAVLAERTPGEEKERAREEFERQMRAYRGQLIASLEVGGR